MKLIKVLLTFLALGTLWNAWESHVANLGVYAWQHEFSQINPPDGPTDNHKAPLEEPPKYNE